MDIGVCDICKIMVGLADQFIDSNKTEVCVWVGVVCVYITQCTHVQ